MKSKNVSDLLGKNPMCFYYVRNLILLLFLLLIIEDLMAQAWPKVYFPGSFPYSVISTYDKGYIIGGGYYSQQGVPQAGIFFKTDINGQKLWHKSIGQSSQKTTVFGIHETVDQGMIIAGSTGITDSWGDPFVMKLNACMETEWCRIFDIGQNRFDLGRDVWQIPGGFILLVYYGGDWLSNEHIHLFRLNTNGDLVWQQSYGSNDSLMIGAEARELTLTSDFHFILTGDCYYPDSTTSGTTYLHPLIIKVDSSGSMEWELPWGYGNSNVFHGMAERTIEDNHHNLFTCGRHIDTGGNPPGDRPTMLKTDLFGQALSFHDPIPGTLQANFFNINWMQDSTIEIDGGWSILTGTPGPIGVLKLDRNGNILDSIQIMQSEYCFMDALVDQDNKIFLVKPEPTGSFWNSYAWKLNSDLEYDTLYTHPFVYDSLCPHPIPSDTIPLDCVIVGLDEPLKNPETGRLKIWPNPTREMFHISIPDKLKTSDKSPFFNLTTVYHQWRSALVEVRDLNGRLVWSKEVTPGERTLDVNVSAWPAGMYAVRLVYNGRTAAVAVVVVRE